MEENRKDIERDDEKNLIRIKKIPLQDLLAILENLYEVGTNFIDLEFFVDPNEVQSVLTITTRPEYMATPEQLEEENKMFEEYEEDDDEDDDPILSKIKKENQTPDTETLSDDEIDDLI